MCLIALSRGLAPSSPLSFCQGFPHVFLHTAESDVFSKVRVGAAQRSNESPSGAFKRQNGLAQQDGGALPRQVPAEGLLGTVNRNEQRQGIIVVMVSCLLPCGTKVALCELDRHLYGALMAIAAHVRAGSLYTSGKA